MPVGSNTTFCCIVGEGKSFGSIRYKATTMSERRLSRRSYASTSTNQGPSGTSGTNVFCQSSSRGILYGTVVFVGCKMDRWMEA